MSVPAETRPLLASPSLSPTSSHDAQSLSQVQSTDTGDDGSNFTSETSSAWPMGKTTKRLYTSHFLSTCNSRVFEFGSVLYLAAIFPGTLLPMSIYAVARGASAILFSSSVGHFIDTANRLRVVRLSIILQRAAVAASCVIFFILSRDLLPSGASKTGMLLALTLLSCIEKLAAIMNMASVERDWVVTIADGNRDYLQLMNSQMRRIDLICKLFGPFGIAIVDGFSTELAILVTFVMNVASIPMEYLFIARIYHNVPQLRCSYSSPAELAEPPHGSTADDTTCHETQGQVSAVRKVSSSVKRIAHDIKLYFNHPAFLPSFASALLYLTVLSFSGRMVTYLLATGYTSAQVAGARTLSVCFEVLATWVGPWLMNQIGPIRAGLWFASWQSGCLLVGISIFWVFSDSDIVSTSGLVGGTIMSRLGLWGFDLCSQLLIQEEVGADHRGSFSATEASWQNTFELLSYLSTAILSSPDQFRYPASASVLAVVAAWLCYSHFVRQRRGHLMHWPACLPEKRAQHLESLERMLGEREGRRWYSINTE